ncbi:MAG: GTPase HflX [Bacteroidota bacterium]|nr:GTPase HflX [Candidatus Kapabacteria bacterium]MDW8219482.1 GTPase HflX [Bacteroidota bacterium]
MHSLSVPRERALAIGVGSRAYTREQSLEHLEELSFLAETAGAEVVYTIFQDRDRPDAATVVGKGKLEEIKRIIQGDAIDIAIFDDELTPAQLRNLSRELGIKVLDRTGLILDIFASRARTSEARLQVELAQLQYLLPRLSRMWTHLSKQFGGIGSKGPGETQIETDRRLVRDRIALLKEKLEYVAVQKAEQRKGRTEMERFALVGYTNAGKSTLMNALTGAEVLIEDKLFATLDTTVRTMELTGSDHTTHRTVLLSDTVGFIRKLPAQLVASFRSTLAETLEADVLLHVVDISHPQFREHIQAVAETLEDIGASGKPTIMVFNKIDALADRSIVHHLQEIYPHSVGISAQRGINIPALQDIMLAMIDKRSTVLRLMIPYSAMKEFTELYRTSTIIERVDTDMGIELIVRVLPEALHRVRQWIIENPLQKP